MRYDSVKLIGVAAAFMLFGCVFLVRIHAQSGGKNSNGPSVTTNWVGCLVIGEKDTIDSISPGAHPKSLEHVQLGLRSDGVVVWRSTIAR